MHMDKLNPEKQIDAGEMNKRLDLVKAELMSLHREMYWMVQDQRGPEQQQHIEELNFDQIMDLKLAVDNMRELLWKYVDAAATVEPKRVEQAMQTHRVRRVGQLLQLLRERLGHYPDHQQPVSFIERVTAVVTHKLAGREGQAA
jgi:hypothetical protein